MKKAAVFFILFLSAFSAAAQSDTVRTADSLAELRYRLCVKFAPLQFFDLYNGGSFSIAAESFPLSRFSVSPEFGFYTGQSGYALRENYGIRGALELRYYYRQSEKSDGYIGLRYMHRKHHFMATDTIGFPGEPIYLLSSPVSKEVNAVDFVWGSREYFGEKNGFAEFFFGIGIRAVDVTYSDISQAELDNRLFGESIVLPMIHSSGYSVMPDLVFGIRLGFGVK